MIKPGWLSTDDDADAIWQCRMPDDNKKSWLYGLFGIDTNKTHAGNKS